MNMALYKDEDSMPSNPIRPRYRDMTQLLYAPLPRDLPTLDKNTLILIAPSYGDIDRHARLHRFKVMSGELHCCDRGIYHTTMFAVWWSKQPVCGIRGSGKIMATITAPFIEQYCSPWIRDKPKLGIQVSALSHLVSNNSCRVNIPAPGQIRTSHAPPRSPDVYCRQVI